MPLSAGTRLGSYEILAPVGAGGMGEVYRAKDTKLKREVALKVLPNSFASDPERMARFQREAEVLASLNHPNIAQIYGVEERALVMELVPGESLKGPLPLETALNYAKQLADALEAAHEKNIIHRDLKPANIMITPAGVVKVLDFGLAAVAQSSDSSDPAHSPTLTISPTRAGMILGTAAYMSPEQAAGKPVDKRADIWSFGVLLWEMLTGQRLFDGETISHTLADVLRAEIDFAKLPKETPASIRGLIRRCLDRDVKTRLRDIGEARVAIQNVGKEPEVPLAAAPSQPRSGWFAWILAGLFVVSTLGLSLVHFRERASEPQVFEYALPAPEGTRLDEFALSPNGRYLVMRAVGERGAQLWLHALDGQQTQPLPGTDDGAAYPFWSPDSNFIGFFAGRKLKKLAVTGGPVQTLCDAPSGRGGTWNQDGVIVFAASNTGGLSRVSSTGGVPTQVTEGSGLRFPVFLPDGRRFLYESPGEEAGTYLGSLDSKEHRRIVAGLSSPAYQPPTASDRNAYVLFVTESTLVAQPVDPKSLDRTGDVFPVAEQLTASNRFKDSYSIAPASGALVYRTGSLANQQLTWVNRQGKVIAKIGEPAPYDDVAISPDGTQIAAHSDGNIWLIDAMRGGRTRFTFGPGGGQSPVWSLDGSRVAFRVDRGGATELDQKASNGASEAERLLASDQQLFKTPRGWSPDRSLLLYDVSDPKTKGDIWALALDGERKPTPLLRTEFNESHGMFSPDGRWFAYDSDESGRSEVYVRPFSRDSLQASDARDKTSGKWVISKNGGALLRWLKKELVYVTPDRKIMSVEVSTAPVFRAGEPQFLFQLPPGASADVTTDGARFLVILPAEEKQSTQLIVVTNWLARLKK